MNLIKNERKIEKGLLYKTMKTKDLLKFISKQKNSGSFSYKKNLPGF